jgi:CDP-glycerol glycerophosphotransferase
MVRAPTTVLFESYFGRNVSCNPRAIDAHIAERWPDVRRVWVVADAGIEVPEGAEPVVTGSPAWRSARERAGLLVINDWITDGWRPARRQFVLQTWHGTPLKRLALSRRSQGWRQRGAVVKQSRRWSAMLAQSPAAAGLLRRAYAVVPAMWTLGYPRNDRLIDEPDLAAKRRLGITTAKVVLYTPTWREGRLGQPDPLPVEEVAASLGPDWTVVVRGHSRTLADRTRTVGSRVLDASDHPDVADLMTFADVLVTDYSSTMFDFSVTGRPMVFHVPDLEEYTSRQRGFYFDLTAVAPGPLTRTADECATAVASADEDHDRWRARYDAWQKRFNPLDDGRASERVGDRLARTGVLG